MYSKSMGEHPIKLQKAWMLACLIVEYKKVEPAGGVLHIVVEDCNYSDEDIKFCIENSENDYWGNLIANMLLEFGEDEREQINERYWEIDDQISK